MKNSRYSEIDFLRGLAVIGMIVYHTFFILDYFGIYHGEILSGGWLYLARIVQIIFLGLVGVSLSISQKTVFKQWKRAGLILLFAVIVNIGTYLFAPEEFVRFGILHLIFFSIILLCPFAHKKFTALLIGLFALIFGLFLQKFQSASLLYIVLGFTPINFNSLDYFPVFPWISIPAFGILLGNILYKNRKALLPSFNTPINYLGQHSLIIYLLHIPLIILALIILRIIPLTFLF